MRVPPPDLGLDRPRLPHAGEVFTDRESESDAFASALKAFRRMLDSDTDTGVARRNVLAYYGLGGIGKSALSERLEAWVDRRLPLDNGWGPPPPTKVAATMRVDLHDSMGRLNIVSVLLALRAGLARVKRRWPAFDLAFATYWSARHPGSPLPAFRGSRELADAITESVLDIVGGIADAAQWAGVASGANVGVRAARHLIGELRRRNDLRVLGGTIPDFDGFLIRCADEPTPTNPHNDLALDIAGLLAWELSTQESIPLAVVFVDTTERLALDPRRTAEGLLSSLVFGMPDVLFVLTGRDALSWHDEHRVELAHRGPHVWPGLVLGTPDEPRQHLVGRLSAADCRTIIRAARRRDRLPMSDSVVEELVAASAGLPQYLELARQVALSVRDAGGDRQVTVADVTGSLGALVQRVLDDVPGDEQRAIRAACLFQVFDADLVAAAAAVDHGCVERALLRPMVDRFPGERLPYRIHDAVRDAVRSADHTVPNGWSERDWQLASSRAAAAIRIRHDAAKEQENNRGVLDALGLAIRLVCDQETSLEPAPSADYGDWLAQAIVYAPSVQGLASRVPATSRTAYGRVVLDFIAGKSSTTALDERLSLLRAVFSTQHPLRAPAGRHLGYALRNQFRWEASLAVFDELVALSPSAVNLRQRVLTLGQARRFDDAYTAAGGTDAFATVRRTTEYAHGCPQRYFDEIEAKIEENRRRGRQREVLEDRADLLFRRVFYFGDVPADEILRFQEEAEVAAHLVAIRDALLAQVVSRIGDVEMALDQLRLQDAAALGREGHGFRSAFGETLDAIVRHDADRLEAVRRNAAALGARSRSWIPVECFLRGVGLDVPDVPTQWLEPFEVVQERWMGHLQRYLDRVNATAGDGPR